ncbi:hypothetical protein [Anaplasma phagocytophilum]|uniref:hypothetical protein n=1 Tax=Anaplasma phagocytophilum TaxID=948 RepID=UPI00035AA93F|nr:hypothetical protein [Anaplasma phagocytophilum]AGR81815.1 hypothetical protein YYY_02055 [Anaplasma phagocytophilum str. Dog2]KDB56189.1 hypothetical protein O997_02060 [Anaplasma phagocytophilum str. MRK]AGR79307.1 hypothetical protein YYU_02020 [Anaplasma phagocytophilum str. HZ2]AGR80556.1 hypothetical protein WSQ_02030 [Anaplasma phagocytophilum str. JM]EOA60779.1 hypothetical protein HGE1_01907 [Anaplasma phagocytophilum str. HGE1]
MHGRNAIFWLRLYNTNTTILSSKAGTIYTTGSRISEVSTKCSNGNFSFFTIRARIYRWNGYNATVGFSIVAISSVGY